MAEAQLGAQIASHTPGRLRIRFDRPHRGGQAMQRVLEHMQDQPGVANVEANPVTGSLVVRYDQHGARREMHLGALSDVGVILHDLTETVGGEELPAGGPGRSTAAISVVDSMSDLDRRLSELTGRKIDLKLLFPLSLGVLGLRQLRVRLLGAQLEQRVEIALERGAVVHHCSDVIMA